MWQKLSQPLATHTQSSSDMPANTSGEIAMKSDASRFHLKKPDLSALKKTNEEVKGWVNSKNPFGADAKRRRRISNVILPDEPDTPPPPYTPSAPQVSVPAVATRQPTVDTTSGALPQIPQSGRSPLMPNGARRRASAPTAVDPPPPYAPPLQAKRPSAPSVINTPTTSAAAAPTRSGVGSTAVKRQEREASADEAPPYSVFTRLNETMDVDETRASGAAASMIDSIRGSSRRATSGTVRVQSGSAIQHTESSGTDFEADYGAAMNEYFDDFFETLDVPELARQSTDASRASVKAASRSQEPRSPQTSSQKARTPSVKASMGSWYPFDSASLRMSGSVEKQSPPLSSQRQSRKSTTDGVHPEPSVMPAVLSREDSDAGKGYPALSVFPNRGAAKQNAAPPSVVPQYSKAPRPTSGTGSRVDSTAGTEGSENDGPLQRVNDLAPSKWAYVAKFATKLKEARETKLRASRINRGQQPTAVPLADRHTVEPSVFTLGRLTDDGAEDDELDDVHVSAVFDDDGNVMYEPTMSMLWDDFVSDEDTAHGHSGYDDLHAEESEGFTHDNLPSMFPGTRARTNRPAAAAPESAPQLAANRRMSRPTANTAVMQPQQTPQKPFARPQIQEALLSQQQKMEQQRRQQCRQQQQQQQYQRAQAGSPQACRPNRYNAQTPSPQHGAATLAPSPPKAYSPQTQRPTRPGPQYYQPQRPCVAPLQGPAPGMPMVKATPQANGGRQSYISNYSFTPQIPPPAPQPDIRGPKLGGRRPQPADFARLYGWRLADARWVESPEPSPRRGVEADRSKGHYNVKQGVDQHEGHRRQR